MSGPLVPHSPQGLVAGRRQCRGRGRERSACGHRRGPRSRGLKYSWPRYADNTEQGGSGREAHQPRASRSLLFVRPAKFPAVPSGSVGEGGAHGAVDSSREQQAGVVDEPVKTAIGGKPGGGANAESVGYAPCQRQEGRGQAAGTLVSLAGGPDRAGSLRTFSCLREYRKC